MSWQAVILAGGGELVTLLLAVLGAWVHLNVRLTRIECRLDILDATHRRIEDALWITAGIPVIPPKDAGQRP